MHLSAPTFEIFIISMIFAALAILPKLGVIYVRLPISEYWLLVVAWVLMTVGVTFTGI